jgi:hypothetical protein
MSWQNLLQCVAFSLNIKCFDEVSEWRIYSGRYLSVYLVLVGNLENDNLAD